MMLGETSSGLHILIIGFFLSFLIDATSLLFLIYSEFKGIYQWFSTRDLPKTSLGLAAQSAISWRNLRKCAFASKLSLPYHDRYFCVCFVLLLFLLTSLQHIARFSTTYRKISSSPRFLSPSGRGNLATTM